MHVGFTPFSRSIIYLIVWWPLQRMRWSIKLTVAYIYQFSVSLFCYFHLLRLLFPSLPLLFSFTFHSILRFSPEKPASGLCPGTCDTTAVSYYEAILLDDIGFSLTLTSCNLVPSSVEASSNFWTFAYLFEFSEHLVNVIVGRF